MDWIAQAAAVGAVFALLAGTLWWLRRKGMVHLMPRQRSGKRMECLERLALTPQHSLHLVRIGEESVLLAVSPTGCNRISMMAAEPFRAVSEGIR